MFDEMEQRLYGILGTVGEHSADAVPVVRPPCDSGLHLWDWQQAVYGDETIPKGPIELVSLYVLVIDGQPTCRGFGVTPRALPVVALRAADPEPCGPKWHP
jgi:hypothetical protein